MEYLTIYGFLVTTTAMNAMSQTASSYTPKGDRDEQASAKLWAVYISQAEKYDKALVDRWRSDMEGLLIFAGLFSGILTAFLIESYKTLTPDQGAITIVLLSQISRQLEPGSNETSIDMAATSITPSLASLACNTFWFLSLGLSLSCALIATLVEQWSRDFIQRTEMHPSPIIRARIFSYLHFGIQRFGVHTMVEFIPMLLHMSLLFFFAGLVAFLLPINRKIMVIVAILLSLISATYIYLTILPIISSDSPYRTPLSNVAWGLFQRSSALFYWLLSPQSNVQSTITDESIPTIVEVMNRDATANSWERDERDGRVIVWTVKSLADDDEFAALVDALPDLIWRTNGRRRGHDRIINMLLDDQNIQLVPRIEGLLRSCDSGLLTSELELRRRITCIKALWSIAYFLATDVSTRNAFPMFDIGNLMSQLNNPAVRSYATSAYWLVRWIGFCSVSSRVQDYLSTMETSSAVQDPGVLVSSIQREAHARGLIEFSKSLSMDAMTTSLNRHVLESFEVTAYDALIHYMQDSVSLVDMPYEFEATCEIIQPPRASASSMVHTRLKDTLNGIVHQCANQLWDLPPAVHHIDIIVDTTLHLLQGAPESFDTEVVPTIVEYIFNRRFRDAPGFTRAFGRCDPHRIRSSLTKCILCGPEDLTQGILLSIWVLSVYIPQLAAFDEETLAAVCTAPHLLISPCTIAVLKSVILTAATHLPPHQLCDLLGRLQISDEGISPPDNLMEDGKGGAWMILIEFLKQIDSPAMSDTYTGSYFIRTFWFLRSRCPSERAPQFFQRRFVAWLSDITNSPSMDSHQPILQAVMDWFWMGHAYQHFDDISTRRTIAEALRKYAMTFTDDPELRNKANVVKILLNVGDEPENQLRFRKSETLSLNSHEGNIYQTPAGSDSKT